MGSTRRSHRSARAGGTLVARPLDTLVFILPLVLFYEIMSVLVNLVEAHASSRRVVAFQLLQVFFEWFGITGVSMPGLAVVAILLATHAVSRRPWRVDRRAVGLMYVESVAWAVPLILLSRFIRMTAVSSSPPPTWVSDLALGVGAGIYEELVFRLILISLIAIVGVDLMRFPQNTTFVAAVLVSAMLFALHHHPPIGAEPFAASAFCFRAMAGVYLGTIFVFRGYGPAAGGHIAYNLLVMAMA